jgi:glycosyltransferase involved in cell wall biosynthesis
MNQICLISNSTTSVMAELFEAKLPPQGNILLLANKKIADKYSYVKTSSFSKTSTGGLWFIVDAIFSFYICFYLLLKNTRVIIFDTAHISNIPLSILWKLLRRKQIFTIHDWTPHPGRNHSATHLYNKYVKKYLADGFIVYSTTPQQEKPVIQLTLGGLSDKKQTRLDPSGDVLFFGRIEPYKGIANLIDITKEMRVRNMKNKVIVAGSGKDEHLPLLNKIDNTQIINRFIKDHEMDGLFRKAAVCVMPYNSATQSAVSLLAYSYGVPVVTYDVGNLREDIEQGKTGFAVPHDEASTFCDRIQDTLNNGQEMQKNVIRRFNELHSSSAVSSKFYQLMRRIKKLYS